MNDRPYIAEVAALIGDPARANILIALATGQAMTATELSLEAGVSPQTTSAHLAKLLAGGLVKCATQGRHRYYRLAGPEIGTVLEALMVLAVGGPKRRRPPGPRDAAVRQARTCYDHLAGKLGVAITDALVARGHLKEGEPDYEVTAAGDAFFGELGIQVAPLRTNRRHFARPCIDWSERRPHLAGALGAAMAERCFALGWLSRRAEGRTVEVTVPGRRGLRDSLGLDVG
jgi:DNA-binding transcriptional ArsR family regulator